ncbi:hypothetical protein PSTG_18105 [Puccinia striiformis f. sp. tritici PST-78]|uniref:Uncharacterized protein n=1 Tax=Puccinia striiformis f. sp. tritici PST-78 TaxID=1165861 RepID=A0A0L0UNF7_9BASI|nr:hypothetical protein PSTG_18105 [Puccinia striiformis f. sp. tritici PST-78]
MTLGCNADPLSRFAVKCQCTETGKRRLCHSDAALLHLHDFPVDFDIDVDSDPHQGTVKPMGGGVGGRYTASDPDFSEQFCHILDGKRNITSFAAVMPLLPCSDACPTRALKFILPVRSK